MDTHRPNGSARPRGDQAIGNHGSPFGRRARLANGDREFCAPDTPLERGKPRVRGDDGFWPSRLHIFPTGFGPCVSRPSSTAGHYSSADFRFSRLARTSFARHAPHFLARLPLPAFFPSRTWRPVMAI